jgi:quinol monooxygenase YgiN
MIVLAGYVRIKPDRIDDVITSAKTMAATSRSEAGCVHYRFSVDVDDPVVVQQFESWESQEALDAHFQTAHFAEFYALMVEVADGESEFVRYEVSAAEPLSV